VASSQVITTTDTTCYKELENNSEVKATEYIAQDGTCYIYSNDGGLIFAEGHVTYARTCQSGNALNYTIARTVHANLEF